MVARFYGFSDSEIKNMLYADFQDYVRAMPIIKAQESLEAITIASYPHSKKEFQNKTHKRLHRAANPDIWGEKKTSVTLEDLAKVIGRG
jgi:hypothetical protein